MAPNKRKPTKKKRSRPRSSRSTWTEGERRIDRMAREAGIEPIGDLEDVPHLDDPEEGEKFLEALRQLRSMDERAREEKEKQKRASRRA